jgi:hypothetical protein
MRNVSALMLVGLLALAAAIGLAKPESLQQQIVAKERQGLDALKVGNYDEFAGLTADDAVFVDSHGPATKAEVMTNTREFRLSDYSMEDVRFEPLSGKSGLIAYKITETGTSHGKSFSAKAYVSSIWAERGGKWVCLFSQETVAR